MLDVDTLLTELTLIGPVNKAELVQAVTEPPLMTRTVDGASTLEVTVTDWDRAFIRSGMFSTRSWAKVDDVIFELVQVRKTGDRVGLTFEDSVAAALRRRREPLSIPAGSATRQEIVARLAAEAGVELAVDPAVRPKVASVVERSAADAESSSWTLLGEVADAVGWRRFSDGRRLVVGSDAWLGTLQPPWAARENTGGVGHIDFDLDVGKPASTATFEVDARLWSVGPGRAVSLSELGPGDGAWTITQFKRPITRQRATVSVERARLVLPEPPPEPSAVPGSESGEPDLLPGQERLDASGTSATAANPARERMVRYALAQDGKPYSWGGSGPRGFDCSGLVQEATRAGGRVLTKPSKSQWSRCRRDGKTISVREALRTRGALLFQMSGDPTHVAISLGDGRTVEARGRATGCGVFGGAATRTWTGGALWL